MRNRLITSVIGLPIVIVVVYLGGWLFLLAFTILSCIGLREVYLAFCKKDRPIHILGYAFTVAYFGVIYFLGPGYWLLSILTMFVIAVLAMLVIRYQQIPVHEAVTTIFGFLYIPFMLSFAVLVRQHYLGLYFIWLIFIIAFGTDSAAYATGMTLGKHKLVNTPSPKKSVEGVIGGIVGAGLLGLAYGFFISRFIDPEDATGIIFIVTITCVVGSAFSMIGDMAASAVKRYTKIKDFGNIFPGHGGVVDRADSIIVVAPIVYMVMTATIWLFN